MQHFPDPCRENAHGVLRIPVGVKNPLRRPCGAGGGPGDHPADLRLGGQQKRTGVFGEHGGGGKGQGLQLRQILQFFRVSGVDAAPGLQPRQGLIQAAKLQSFQSLPGQLREGLYFTDPIVQSCFVHFRYSALPWISVRL